MKRAAARRWKNPYQLKDKRIHMVLSAFFAALSAVFAQIEFHLGPVPYTMQNFIVILAAITLKPKYAALSQAIYLLSIGFNMPAASGFRGGPQVLVGYTAGYLWMFPVSCYLMSCLSRKYAKASPKRLLYPSLKDIAILLAISFLSVLPIYVFGFLVFCYYALQPTALGLGLKGWSKNIVSHFGFNLPGEILVLFIASVLVFVPQDLFIDHLLAIIIATRVLRFMKKQGLHVP